MADLHPMELGEILDGALTIYRRHLALFLKIGVVALWLPVALMIYVQLAGGVEQHIGLWLLATVVGSFANVGTSKIWPLFAVWLGKGIIAGLLVIVIIVLIALAGPAFGGGGGAGALLMVLLAIAGGCWFVCFVLCGYAVTTPVVVLETLGGAFDAFGRSWDLTRGFKFKLFVIWVVALLVVYVPILALAMLGGYFSLVVPWAGHATQIFSALLPMLVYPIFSCILTLMYYDLRVRREAFDLQVLGQQLGIS